MLASTKRDKFIDGLLPEIKKADGKLYLAITGGGTRAISRLLENGGASGVFLGATIPYDQADLTNITGPFDKAVSEKTAIAMTKAGYLASSSGHFADEKSHGICISCTCSLAKDGERKDREHVAYFGISTYDWGKNIPETVIKINFKEKRTRLEEEEIVSAFILCLAFNKLTLSKWHITTVNYEQLGLTKEEIEEVKFHLDVKPAKKSKEEKEEKAEESSNAE